jgi:hypothetical protein
MLQFDGHKHPSCNNQPSRTRTKPNNPDVSRGEVVRVRDFVQLAHRNTSTALHVCRCNVPVCEPVSSHYTSTHARYLQHSLIKCAHVVYQLMVQQPVMYPDDGSFDPIESSCVNIPHNK